MKKIFTLFAAVALTASAAMAEVITLDLNKPINPTSLEYNENGIWTGCYNDVDYTWLEFGDENGEFGLSHLIDGEGASWGGYYWDGFCPAIGGDQAEHASTWTTQYGGCMAGGGCVINEDGTVTADPSQPYLVAYYSSWAMEGPSNQVVFVDKDGNTTFKPVGVYVCNHPWPYYGCVHGDGMARPFEEGDYFQLTAHGVDSDGEELATTSINLVEYTNGQLNALNDWTFFDLSSLGEVEAVYFTLSSTDTGSYGMNTASYFCMDKFMIEIPEDNSGYYMVGTFNGWNQTAEGGRKAFDEEDRLKDVELEANAEFKIITLAEDGGWTWLGGVDENNVGYFLIDENLMGVSISLTNGANFRIAEAGTYDFELMWLRDDSNLPDYLRVTPSNPSAISSITTGKVDNNWYNLQGQKFNGKPTTPGIYINNGRKVIIK